MDENILENLRQDYRAGILDESDTLENPNDLFEKWFNEALQAGLHEPNAMTLASVDGSGQPSARIVLLKGFSQKGFVFYSNYSSRKGLEMQTNPKAALLFYWGELERQIRIGGIISKLSKEESINYFNSRPRSSRIGAIVSPQSQIIPNRTFLDDKWKKLENNLKEDEIIKPENWGGYLLKPIEFEFWQGRSSRLHDRIQYSLKDNVWVRVRLAP